MQFGTPPLKRLATLMCRTAPQTYGHTKVSQAPLRAWRCRACGQLQPCQRRAVDELDVGGWDNSGQLACFKYPISPSPALLVGQPAWKIRADGRLERWPVISPMQ